MAADEILLDSLNTAFAAACIENGVDSSEVSASDITIGDDKTVVKADINVTTPAEKATAIQEDFASYYEGGTFKVIKTLKFVKNMGVFVDANAETVTTEYNGVTLTFSQDDIDALNASTFMTSSSLGGVSGLLNKVSDVTAFAAGLMDSSLGSTAADLLTQVFDSDEFIDYISGVLPEAEQEALIDQLMDSGFSYDAAVAQVETNMAVLYASQAATKMDTDDVLTLLKSGSTKSQILTTMNSSTDGSTTTAFAQAALAYGMYTAYANSTECSDSTAKDKSVLEVLSALDTDSGFASYLTTSQAETDLAGYMSALNMINSGSTNTDAVSGLLLNGFSDSDLIEALESAVSTK